MENTNEQFQHIILLCKDLFVKKMQDYGTAWRILRTPSLTDQLFIKAMRIRSIETKKQQQVADDIRSEYMGIINYAIMALIQLELGHADIVVNENEQIVERYGFYAQKALELMKRKNHDYDEAWRSMRIESYTDLIIMKLYRTKQIEDNAGRTLVSEGLDANYMDMINYAVFAMIKIEYS